MKSSGKKDDVIQAVWTFAPKSLRPGDIVLERGHSLISKSIMAIDRGEYSHALMWIDSANFIEAVDMGVRVISYPRFFIVNPGDWILLRHPDPNIGRLAATEARFFSHMKYGLGGAVATKIPGNWKTNPAAMFCSQVVAAAYENIGSPLVSKPSNKVSPNDLISSPVLGKVMPIPMIEKKISEDEKKEIEKLLDRDHAYARTDMARELVVSQEVYSLVYDLYPSLMIPPEHRLLCPPRNFDEALKVIRFLDWETASNISSFMLPALEHRGYFDFLTYTLQELTERLEDTIDYISAGFGGRAEIIQIREHYSENITPHRETAERYLTNADHYDTLCKHIFTLPIFVRLEQMYRSNANKISTIVNYERVLVAKCTERLNALDEFSD